MLDLPKNGKYLLACSYGPDSMALFDMLYQESIPFEVAHVNYHLREESNFEEKRLREYCEKLNIKIHVKDVEEIITSNIEARCRGIRYDFFNSLYKENGYDALLVAHNEDDHIETYLLQKQRKNLVKHYGLRSQSVFKDMLVLRPLLSQKKNELLGYCIQNHVPYAIDASNMETTFLRNKIRINVVSKMSDKERAEIVATIANENKQLEKMFDKLEKVPPKVDDLLALNDVELAYYLNSMVNAEDYKFNVTYNNSKEIRKVLESKTTNIVVPIHYNKYAFEKSYGKLIFRENVPSQGYEYVMNKPLLIDNDFFFVDFTGDTSNRNVSIDDYPLTIRTFKKGDTYIIKDYQVQVRRLFIDWKMPLSIRQRWPVIVNKEGRIIYIPRYRSNFKVEKESNFYVKECFTFH